jgi:hypothetical protein
VDDEAHRRRILVQLNRHEKRHEPDVAVDFVVDDNASVVDSYGGYRVQPFEGDPWDEELLRVPEAVEAWGA